MTVYRYDGTFCGFLCAAAAARHDTCVQPEFVRNGDGWQMGLFAGDMREVATERATAGAFREAFINRVSRNAFATARYAFHSRQAGIENLLWRYLHTGLKEGKRLERMLAVEPVHTLMRIARRVSHEAHKYKGFVRFREVAAGFLYASIEPEADIVELIAPHFTARVGDRPWLIHDLCRSRAALFDTCHWRLVEGLELAAVPECSGNEERFARLWRTYFEHLAIAERHNPALQQQHVPLRYRAYLTEFA